MPIPTANIVAAQITARLGDTEPASLAAWTAVCDVIITAIKQASVLGTGPVPMTVAVGGTPSPVLGVGKLE